MIRILIILNGVNKEGITTSVLTYLEAIDRVDLDIRLGIAGASDRDMLIQAEALVIPVYFLPNRIMEPFKYFRALVRLLKKDKFDIIHVHGNSATLGVDMLAAASGGVKIRIAHSHSSSNAHPRLDKVLRPLFNATYTDGFACGRDAGKWLFRNKDYTVIPNGKNINRFLFDNGSRTEIRNELNLQDKKVIGHAGVFIELKNHLFLIEVFKELYLHDSKYILCLLGSDGGYLAKVKEKVVGCGLQNQVIFLGFKANIEQYLCAMDIMVLPSLYEGLPNVVIEGQMSGLPCLLSDRITKECRVMENIVYLPLEAGAKAWADYIAGIKVNDRNEKRNEVRKKMAESGYDIEVNAAKLKELYMSLSDGRKRANE